MRKLSYDAIQSIIKRACKEFLEADTSSDCISFYYKGHYVEAKFAWSEWRHTWYLFSFTVVYSRCTMQYFVGNDYDTTSALCL